MHTTLSHRAPGRKRGLSGQGARDAEPERGARALFALDTDAAVVLLDDGLADRQAEAGAALLARVGGVHLAEALEDDAAVRDRDAAAAIDDAEDHGVLLDVGGDLD